ncbi:MAG: Uma2 family endonuclease [Dehalococcoidia bacterium]
MTISVQTYEQLALEDVSANWELAHGIPRKKPSMTTPHYEVMTNLAWDLMPQLDRDVYTVRVNVGRVHVSTGSYYVPDLFVIPRQLLRRGPEWDYRLEVFAQPLPLVAEVWSRSTGDYDVEVKLQEYQLRGDAEIWRLHPYEQTLTTWRRQPDGTYVETLYRGGTIEPVALPGVRIEIEKLFP